MLGGAWEIHRAYPEAPARVQEKHHFTRAGLSQLPCVVFELKVLQFIAVNSVSSPDGAKATPRFDSVQEP